MKTTPFLKTYLEQRSRRLNQEINSELPVTLNSYKCGSRAGTSVASIIKELNDLDVDFPSKEHPSVDVLSEGVKPEGDWALGSTRLSKASTTLLMLGLSSGLSATHWHATPNTKLSSSYSTEPSFKYFSRISASDPFE